MEAEAAQRTSPPAWDGVVRRQIDITTRAVDREARSIEVVASSDTVDSHGDIVEQDWKLDRYKKNSPVLWHHNIFESSRWSFGGAVRPEDLLPIGHAEDVRVEGGKLVARLVFGTEKYNPMSEKVFLGFVEGHLKAVSVGFYPGKITEEQGPGKTIFRLSECELLEISVVPIPSNPDAVAKSIAWEHEHLARMAGSKKTAISGEEIEVMPMTAEEKALFDEARADAKSAKERVSVLEGELKSEKAASAKLDAELKSASERAAKAEAGVIEAAIDKLVGSKLAPAERDEHVQLAKDIGLERVQKILAARPDLKMLSAVTVDGKQVAHTEQPAPPPAAGGDGSADIVKAANAASNAA